MPGPSRNLNWLRNAADGEVGDLGEQVAALRVGDDLDLALRLFGEDASGFDRFFDGRRGANRVDDVVDGGAIFDLAPDDGVEGALRVAAGHEIASVDHHGERDGSLAQVVAGGFADAVRFLSDIEYVVNDLEGHADIAAILADGLNVVFGRIADDGAHFGGSGKERRRFSIDALFVIGAVLLGSMRVHHFAELAIADIAKRSCEDGNDAGAASRGGEYG